MEEMNNIQRINDQYQCTADRNPGSVHTTSTIVALCLYLRDYTYISRIWELSTDSMNFNSRWFPTGLTTIVAKMTNERFDIITTFDRFDYIEYIEHIEHIELIKHIEDIESVKSIEHIETHRIR